jgi:serine/threonine protein kinase
MDLRTYQQVRELFEAALNLRASERTAFVEHACSSDGQLRVEVHRLLNAYENADELLKSAAPAADLFSDEFRACMAGRRIGPYQVLRELGEGGMGTVYLARRADQAFQKEVALKLVRPLAGGAELLNRFQQEREILASLDHPNVARLLDGGSTPEGAPYLVMEYVDGVPIDEYCDAKRLDISARLRLFQTVCAAVQYAHRNLVVHRDLKPSNILVTPDGTVKLLDFGIAKLLVSREEETQFLTRTGGRPMTPGYASPEQVKGETITTASDVYSLGVVLFELMTGTRPYRPAQPLMHEILRAICEQEPLRPSTAVQQNPSAAAAAENREDSPSRLQRRLRGDLDNILLKALAKDPARRYGSAEQFREDLERHLAGLPVRAQRDTVGYRARKFVGRNRGVLALAASVLVALLGGIVGTTREATVANAERWRAETQAVEAQRQSARATAQQEVAERERAVALQERQRAESERARAQRQTAEAERHRAEAEHQAHEAERQREVARRRFTQVRQVANSLLSDLHDQLSALPFTERARDLVINKSIDYLAELAKDSADDTALQLELAEAYQRGANYMRKDAPGDLPRRIEHSRKALELWERLLLADPRNKKLQSSWASSFESFGVLLILTDAAAAVEHARHGLAMSQQLADMLPDDTMLRQDLILKTTFYAIALRANGKLPEAMAQEQNAARMAVGSGRPDPLPGQEAEIGHRLTIYEKWEEAEPHYRRAVELQPRQSALRQGWGWTLSRLHREQEAEQQLREAIRLAPGNEYFYLSLGEHFMFHKHFDKAEQPFRDAARLAPNLGRNHRYLAASLAAQGKLDEAEAEYREALRLTPDDTVARAGLQNLLTTMMQKRLAAERKQ